PLDFAECVARRSLSRPRTSDQHPEMKTKERPYLDSRRILLPVFVLALTIPSLAQAAPNPAPDARTLAKYDLNQNGKLDPDELVALRADEAKAAKTPVETSNPPASEEPVQLSPFQVTETNKGYYAANTMSGTRLNTKIEDLGS